MATHARTLIAANGLADVIEVFQCPAEELQLPEKVDVIISEWMGCVPRGCGCKAARRVARFSPPALTPEPRAAQLLPAARVHA